MQWPRITSRGLIILAGVALVAVGGACLYLSDAVASAGSWSQSTLDAFGVGFVVGGIVDVTAISWLNNRLLGGGSRYSKGLNRDAEILLDEVERVLNRFARGTVPGYGDWSRLEDRIQYLLGGLRAGALDAIWRARLLDVVHEVTWVALKSRMEAEHEDEIRRVAHGEWPLKAPDATVAEAEASE
jgi:hypothetical protein